MGKGDEPMELRD